MNDTHLKYHNYLLSRSRLGAIYRRYYLYPILGSYCRGRLLDVGCGIGDFLSFRRNSVGVDVNPYNIAHCLKEGLDASLVVDGKFPFEKSYFDTVILDNVIEHIDHPGAVLQESTRVLSESGRLIIGVPGLKGYHSDTDHVIFHDKNSLSIILRSVGFCLRNSFSTPFIFQSQLLSTRFSRYSSYFVFSRAIGY